MSSAHQGRARVVSGVRVKKPKSLPIWALALSSVLGVSDAKAQLLLGKGSAARAVDATIVVVREGGEMVLTLSARAEGGSDELAWILPVSSTLDLRSLDPSSVAPLERVTRPRFAELWEQDPCEHHGAIPPLVPAPSESAEPRAPSQPTADASAASAPFAPAPSASAQGSRASAGDSGARFRTEVLGGSSASIYATLEQRGFVVPEAARQVLAGALDSGGAKLLVATVPASELGEDRRLPALRVHTSATPFVIPTRLYASSGSGAQLRVHVIAPHHRFEAAGQPNLAVPTNLDVHPRVRSQERAFYERLIARSFAERPGSVLTEYAWRASTCEGCEAPLDPEELDELGLALLPTAKSGRRGEVIVRAEQVCDDPGGPAKLRRALSDCYAAAQLEGAVGGGSVSVAVDVEMETLRSGVGAKDYATHGSLHRCVQISAESSDFDRSGTFEVEFVPVSRAYLGSLVLTTLRARYDAVPDEDLVLRPARAIEGGREIGPSDRPEQRVYWAERANNFQARYAVRHAFGGEVSCASPKRGVWWERPPAGWKAPSTVEGLPSEELTGATIARFVRGELPPLEAYAIAYEEAPPLPPAEPEPEPEPEASPSAVPSAGTASSLTAKQEPRRTSWAAVGLGLATLLGLGALALRARRQAALAEREPEQSSPRSDPPRDDHPRDDGPGDQPPR